MPNQETNMLLRNTLAEEGRPVDVPTGYVPRASAAEAHAAKTEQLAPVVEHMIEPDPPVPTFKGIGHRFMPSTQPDPTPNQHPAVWPLVMVDMAGRDKLGRERYGTPLQPHNGRDALRDAYEEALDLAVYLRTAMYERDGK